MRLAPFALVALLVSAMTAANAQSQTQNRPPSPQEMKQIMDATMGAMVPMMGMMTEVMIEAQLKMAERPETATRIAAFKKNLFDALQKKGFTAEQAMQITLATSIPSATPAAK